MCKLAPDSGEEKGIQGRGNSTNSGLEGAWPGKSGYCRRSGQRPDCRGWGGRAAKEGSSVKEDVTGVRRMCRVFKSMDSGLRFKSHLCHQSNLLFEGAFVSSWVKWLSRW